MNRPKDIPEDVWDDAGDLIDDWAIEFSLAVVISGNIGRVLHQRIARALVAYGQRRADEARESAAQVAVEVYNQAAVSIRNEAGFPERQYPWRLVQEKAGFIATAIRSLK